MCAALCNKRYVYQRCSLLFRARMTEIASGVRMQYYSFVASYNIPPLRSPFHPHRHPRSPRWWRGWRPSKSRWRLERPPPPRLASPAPA